jgi:hypothetical protein
MIEEEGYIKIIKRCDQWHKEIELKKFWLDVSAACYSLKKY